ELPQIYGMFGILLVFSLKFYPFVFLLTASGLGAISPSVEEAAESLGAGPWRRFFKVTLPLVFPAVSSGALLAFVLSIADFGTPAIVGGKVRLLATTAFDLFTAEMGGNPGLASATSVVLIAVSMAVVVLQRWAVRRRDIAGSLIRRPSPQRLGPIISAAAHFVCYAIVVAGSLPSLVVIYTSFRKTSGPVFHPGFSLDSYARILGEVPHVIVNSFAFSTGAVLLIVILGTLIGYILARRETLAAGALDSVLLVRSEEHTSELQSRFDLVCRLLLEKKKKYTTTHRGNFYTRSMRTLPRRNGTTVPNEEAAASSSDSIRLCSILLVSPMRKTHSSYLD